MTQSSASASGVPGAEELRRMRDLAALATDAVPEPLSTAATVLLVREGEDGAEVLMLRRPETISFAGAWVFPGGRIDPEDGLPGDDDLAVAAAAGARETEEETGLVVAPHDLQPIAVWDPPVTLPKRIRTWFFVASAPEGTIVAAEAEVAEAEWVRPVEMLARHSAGAVTLYPPTFVTLIRLGEARSVAAVLEAATGETAVFRSTLSHADGGSLVFSWGDDDGSADTPVERRHRLDTSTLPWRYVAGPL